MVYYIPRIYILNLRVVYFIIFVKDLNIYILNYYLDCVIIIRIFPSSTRTTAYYFLNLN